MNSRQGEVLQLAADREGAKQLVAVKRFTECNATLGVGSPLAAAEHRGPEMTLSGELQFLLIRNIATQLLRPTSRNVQHITMYEWID
jgi:hypothetical protein